MMFQSTEMIRFHVRFFPFTVNKPFVMIYSYCFVEEGEAAAVRGRGAGETNEEREKRGARAPTAGEYHIQSLH